MDKSWMMENKYFEKYALGVSLFMKFVRENMGARSKVRCPCQKCLNVYYKYQDEVEADLHLKGMSKSYTTWFYHGEKSNSTSSFKNQCDDGTWNCLHDDEGLIDDGVYDLLQDVYPRVDEDEIKYRVNYGSVPTMEETKNFSKLLDQAQSKLLPEYTDMSILSFIVKLLHTKVYTQMSNKSINIIFALLREAFPTNTIPSSYYEAIRILRNLWLNYVLIHACKYDCTLFWAEFKDRQSCPICGTLR